MSATMTTGKNLVESKLRPETATYRHVINAGAPWIHAIKQGTILPHRRPHGNQAVDALFYNAHDYSDPGLPSPRTASRICGAKP